VGGGGAAGLNVVAIAARLGCPEVLVPETGAALSAAGALLSDVSADFGSTHVTSSDDFDAERVNEVLAALTARCRHFAETSGQGLPYDVEYAVEARYPRQNWELEVPIPLSRFDGPDELRVLLEAFHEAHERVFAISEPGSRIEIVTWRARVRCILGGTGARRAGEAAMAALEPARQVYVPRDGWTRAAVVDLDRLGPGESFEGPAIAESSFTTIVVDAGASARKTTDGTLKVTLEAHDELR
jgi:N-methylhydantoinase A